jgi:hypothetical protein
MPPCTPTWHNNKNNKKRNCDSGKQNKTTTKKLGDNLEISF